MTVHLRRHSKTALTRSLLSALSVTALAAVLSCSGASGARMELGLRMRDGRGAGRNLYLCGGWNEIVIPATELVPLWGLGGRREFKWEEAESLSVLTGAWLFKGESAAPQEIEFAGLEWLPLEPVLRLEALPDDGEAALIRVLWRWGQCAKLQHRNLPACGCMRA